MISALLRQHLRGKALFNCIAVNNRDVGIPVIEGASGNKTFALFFIGQLKDSCRYSFNIILTHY